MVNDKLVIAIVCARGGSKGLPGKNIRPIGGKPLLAWTIEEARHSQTLDRLILSSDDPLIVDVAGQYGCEAPVPRPAKFATDESPVEDAILHALEALTEKYDYVALLQPTSPLRLAEDLDGCIRLCIEREAPFAFTIVEPASNPNLSFYLKSDGQLEPQSGESFYELKSRRRQDLPKIAAPNGAVFVARVSDLQKSRSFYGKGAVGYMMPPERSVDIDREFDFMIAETLLQERAKP